MTSPMQTPEFIYKVASREIYDASLAAGSFVGQPIDNGIEQTHQHGERIQR